MANFGRMLGVNISALMGEAGMKREELAKQLGYMYRDISRLLEGRLLLPPVELERVAAQLNTTKGNLIHGETVDFVPELQYLKEFDNPENLDKVLDLLDEYIELKESL